MPASAESATSEARRALIYAPNWLGDCVMAMPALAALARASTPGRLTVLSIGSLAPLWALCPFVGSVCEIAPGAVGVLHTAARLRHERLAEAFILPNSFRSALIPFLAGIPLRQGAPGHQRRWMLTRVSAPRAADAPRHQMHELAHILGVSATPGLALPLSLPGDLLAACRSFLAAPEQGGSGAGTRWVAMIPGAARGPAKRWPPEHFAALARRLRESANCRILLLGTAEERPLCEGIATAAGGGVVNHAGRTNLRELAAYLRVCGRAVTNDSGGMHLAAAVGARVVAIYGQTDPARTGPLGEGHVILQDSEIRSRDIGRHAPEAEASLRRIAPERVYDAMRSLLP